MIAERWSETTKQTATEGAPGRAFWRPRKHTDMEQQSSRAIRLRIAIGASACAGRRCGIAGESAMRIGKEEEIEKVEKEKEKGLGLAPG